MSDNVDENFSGPPLVSPENGSTGICMATSPASSNGGGIEKLRTQTFLITLSPKTDIDDCTVDVFVKYIKKKTLYAFCVTELGNNGKKHLHCCAVWQMPVEKRNIFDYWSKKMVQWYPGSKGCFACKVTVQYDHKWYDEYLRKGGDVVYDNYERDAVTRFFPDERVQARLIELKGHPELRTHIAFQLCDEWLDKSPNDSSYESAISFLKHRMYVERKTPLFIDNRKLQQMCWFLYECRNELIDCTVDDRNYAGRMTGNSIRE